MAGAKRAADADAVMSTTIKKSRIDTPVSSPSQYPSPSRGSRPTTPDSIADSSFTKDSTSSRRRPKTFVCNFSGCGKAFDRPAKLQGHINSHTGERPHACIEEGCDKKFYKSEHLRMHVNTVHSSIELACTYVTFTRADGSEVKCGMTFKTTSRLKRHIANHKAKEETKCEQCGQHFRKIETLQRHVMQEHLKEKNVFRCTVVVQCDDGMDEVHENEECGQTFPTTGKLKQHKRHVHDKKKKKYICSICATGAANDTVQGDLSTLPESDGEDIQAAAYASYNELQAHIREAHPPTCPACGTVCATNKALKAHVDIHHGTLSDRQTHPCTWPGCDRSFTSKGNLNVHVQSVHVKAKKYVCGEFDLGISAKVDGWDGNGCGAVLGTKASLESHVQTKHMGISKPIRPSRLRKKVKMESDDVQDLMPFLDLNASTPTNTDSSAATPGGSDILGLLTGQGYADNRPFACLTVGEGCLRRFSRHCDLVQHMERTHGWMATDVLPEFAMGESNTIGDEESHLQNDFKPNNYPDDFFTTNAFADEFDPHYGWYDVQSNQESSKAMHPEASPSAGLDDMFGEEAMALDPALMEE